MKQPSALRQQQNEQPCLQDQAEQINGPEIPMLRLVTEQFHTEQRTGCAAEKTDKQEKKPEAVLLLEEMWPKLNDVRRLKVESVVQALAYLVQSDDAKTKDATA